MKSKLSIICGCFLLLTGNSLLAQVHRYIKPVPGNNIRHMQPISTQSFTQSCPADTILLTSQAQINNFSVNYATCTMPNFLLIDGEGASPAITSLAGLGSITAVANKLQVKNTSVTGLGGMSGLTQVDTLELYNNPLMTNIGLNNMVHVGNISLINLPLLNSLAGLSNHIDSIGSLHIDSTALTNLNGLNNITRIVDGELNVQHTPIINFNSLNNLSYIRDYFYLNDDSALVSIGMNNLHHAYGFLFGDLPKLASIAGLADHLDDHNIGTFWFVQTGLSNLSGMSTVTGSSNFYIWLNPNLNDLNDLGNISGNVDGFSVWLNGNITTLQPLHKITSINYGTLDIHSCNFLTSLRGLENIAHIGGGVSIDDNQLLDSLTILNPNLTIDNNNGDNVIITNNPLLSVCSFAPLCNYLANASISDIHDNASGCSSAPEILAACTNTVICSNPDAKTWNGSVNYDWSVPGNWTPTGVPGACTVVTIPDQSTVDNTPQAVGNLDIRGLIMEPNAYLNMDLFNLSVTKTLSLDDCSIEGVNNIFASTISAPLIQNTYIEGNFSCTDFGGTSEFNNNTFNGNVVLSDSSGRNASCRLSYNYIYGNLTCTLNSDYGNFYLSNETGYYGNDYVGGNLRIINNSTGNFSAGEAVYRPLKVNGDVIITTNSTGGINFGTLTFTGYNSAHLGKTGGGAFGIDKLVMEKYNSVTLDNDIYLYSLLQLDDFCGEINTTANTRLIFNSTALSSATGLSGFVNGPVKKSGNSAFTFPIGKIENGGAWKAFLSITAPASATDEFTAEYFHRDPTADGYDTAQVTGVNNISGKEYWNLARNNGTSNVKVTLPYDSGRSGVQYNYALSQVAGWNGSKWRSWGSGGYSGYIYGGTLMAGTAADQYGPFTFSFKPVRKPVITLSAIDTIRCAYNNWYLPFTLDTAMIQGNTFNARISDTLGVFSGESNYIGYKQSSAISDSISCFFPQWAIPGKQYKVRITATQPLDTSVNMRTVVFLYPPQQNFTIVAPPNACVGTVQKYYPSLHEAGATYVWDLNYGGTINTVGDTAFITWTATGNHYLNVRPYGICGYGPQAAITVYVNTASPTATPVINNAGRWLYGSQASTGAGYQWYRNGTAISNANNNSFYASLSGSYTLQYTGVCGNSPVSNTISFAANAVAQTIDFQTLPNKVYGDAPFVPAATATSGLPVSFTVISGPATINTQTNLITIIGTGTVTLRADQPGDDTYDTAAPVTRSFAVNKASQIITFTAIANQDISINSLSLSATSNSGLAVSYTVVSGPATVSGNVLTLSGIGTITVKASQAGDDNYLPAADVSRSFCSYVSHLDAISGFNNLCPGTATYSVNNISGATYNWRIAGGSTLTSSTNTANITWSTPGTYILIVSATGNCGAASVNDSLSINVINSILPDSVHGMLPANGATNQQLPLTLSWIPAQPANFYTFDLYLWKASDAQPSTPYAAGITTVNYTFPVSSGLQSNTPYKWMIVAHNGSCIQISTGPKQQFTLIPLPDLIAGNVQAPATAFSGQNISVSWTVSNPGPGKTTTNQSWTDAVFLSFDSIPNFNIPPNTNPNAWSQLDFPVRPLLIGTKPNVSALDPGQSYSNSVSFTLPVNYSQPLYAYVITNYPAGGNAPQQQTYANDTARAPQPIMITLSPTPDLRVDTVFTPNTTFSGSTINLTYKVKNYGVLTPSGTAWTDKFYISSSPIFNINTALALKVPKANGTYYSNAYDAVSGHSTQLPADSNYSNNVSVVVPNYIFGNFFIYVFTNAEHQVYEGALANNNINSNPLQVFLTPTPHLTLSTVTLPVTEVSTTQPIGVNWNILNTGFNDNIEKNKGHYFIKGGSCLIPAAACGCTTADCVCPPPPPPIPGIYFIDSLGFGGSYWRNHVYLSTDSSGLDISSAIDVGSNNQGNENSGLYTPDNYYNTDADGCKQASSTGENYNANTYNVIRPNANYPSSFGFNIPDYLTPGNYYVYVYANSTKSVYEYPGTAEIKRGQFPITVQRPDAVVSAISAPSAATGGQLLSLGYTITNNGPGKVFSHLRNDHIYVSSSPVFDGSAQLIGTQTFTEELPLATGVQHVFTYSFPPSTSGTRYFYVHTNYDSAFRETNAYNNISAAAAVTVTPGNPADLMVSAIQLADTVYTAYSTYFKYTVPNTGSGTTAGIWKDSIFISCNPLFNNSTNIFVAERMHHEALAPGGSYTDSFYVSIPLSFYLNSCFTQAEINTAYFFIKTNADNGVYEGSNTNNNITVSGSRILINPLVDHIVPSVTGADTATVGRQYTTGWTVKNIGQNPGQAYYYGWFDAVYFSPDSVQNANAIPAMTFGENNLLGHNVSYNELRSVTVPNIASGDYYVLVRSNAANGIAGEKDLTNNTGTIRNAGAAKKIHVIRPLLPDLIDSVIASPLQVAVGQPVTIVHRVTNAGAGATYPSSWSDDMYLSADFIPGSYTDILLASKTHSGVLQPGQYFDDTVTVTIPLNATPANYVIISRVNYSGNVFETNSDNNLAFKYINVYSPAPADLLVESINMPDSIFLGYEIDTAKWIIKNNSPNGASGISADGIYLSHATVLDSTALLIGVKQKSINMSPLSRDTISFTPSADNVTEGFYNVIVKTDVLNNITESNKNNNVTTAAAQLHVVVKELPFNVLTANTLGVASRFYKLIVPDSLNGATILVTLTSNDSLSVKNQLFIGLGYVPTAAHFDYSYNNPNYGNQQIVMASVTSGTYYITVRCATANAPVQNITLKAVKLPFALLSVNASSGGNSGNVTVKLSGSLFNNMMTARLNKSGTVIYSSNIYFVNSTTVYATFNLQGQPFGVYDVTLRKTDSTEAVLPASFSVVAPNNGGIQGGGINTGPTGDGTEPGCDPGAPAGLNAQLVTEMIVPDKVFAGWVFVIQLNYSNPTNTDISAQTKVLYSLNGLPVALSPDGLAGAGTSLYLVLTEQNGPPGIIRAGGSGTVTIYSKAPLNFPGHAHAYFSLK